jgi:hypothetical protein
LQSLKGLAVGRKKWRLLVIIPFLWTSFLSFFSDRRLLTRFAQYILRFFFIGPIIPSVISEDYDHVLHAHSLVQCFSNWVSRHICVSPKFSKVSPNIKLQLS